MPTYEYTCKKCGENFDIVQSFKDNALKKHPGDCGGPVQKVFHASGIVFKGSGFYVTDSRGASSVKTPAGDSSKDSSNGSSDTKAAPKKDGKKDAKKADTSSSASSSSASSTTASSATKSSDSGD